VYTDNSVYNQYIKAERLKDLICITYIYCFTDTHLLASRSLIWNDIASTKVNVFTNYSLENVAQKPVSLPGFTMILFLESTKIQTGDKQ